MTSSAWRGRRSALVMAAVLFLAAAGAVAVAATSDGNDTDHAAAPTVSTTVATVTPTSAVSPTTTVAPTTTTAPPQPAPTTAAVTRDVPVCTNEETALDIQPDEQSYTADEVVHITASITNRSDHDCVLPGQRELTVRRGGEVVTMSVGMADGAVWAAGDVARIELVWDHGDGQPAHEPGSYEATASFTTDAGTSYTAMSAFTITAQ